MKQQLTWDDFSRAYEPQDITANTIIVEVISRGMACAPVAFKFWFLVPDTETVRAFHEALAGLSGSDGEEESFKDEITFLSSLSEFLSKPEHQAELLEDYNLYYEDKLHEGYKFNLHGGEALLAAALNAANSLQF